MPTTPPEANRLERQAEVVLTPEGSITATVRERSQGQAAVGAQMMQDRLMVFKPAIVSRLDALALTKPSRKSPVVLARK